MRHKDKEIEADGWKFGTIIGSIIIFNKKNGCLIWDSESEKVVK